MNHAEIIETEKKYIMQTYGRLPITVDHGENAVWYDTNGKKYIDFTSGIGVNSLGLCDREWTEAVKKQLDHFSHCSNYYYSESSVKLAQMVVEASGMSNIFFCNSGAEANEGAIKVCRKYSFDKYGSGRSKFITLQKSFHGRTIATLTATGQDKFHQWFGPWLPDIAYAQPNMESVRSLCDGSVCGILVEPIQGESGVYPMDASFMTELRAFCDEQDILLCFDEVQCGIGRTGKLFAFQNYQVQPDVLTLAKGLGGGLPIGAFLCGEKAKDTLGKGMHGTTFGSNPVVCAGGVVVMNRMTDHFLEEVQRKGNRIVEKVLRASPKAVIGWRGMGLMIGFVVAGDPHSYLEKAAQKGLLILSAGSDVIRLLPPLTITDEEIDEGVQILLDVLDS
jgi:acetylornithine/N-succinyldiaminopimelate aminotransferase